MSATLYKNGAKNSAKMLIIFAALLSMYAAVITTMFDPEMGSVLAELQKSMPEMMAIMGMSGGANAELIDFVASYLYGFLVPVVPMVYVIITANNLVANKVDTGAMVYFLASPVKRRKIVHTQADVLISGIVVMFIVFMCVCMLSCQLMFPGQLNMGKFMLLNLGAFCLHLLVSGICFLASCIFNTSGRSLAVGAGICTVSYIVQMLANAGQQLEGFRYVTFFTLFNPEGIIAGETSAYVGIACMAAAGLALYAAASHVFVKKDIPV